MKKEVKHFNIEEINSYEFLKSLSYKELNVLSGDIRNYIVDITARFGGHLSSNLGSVESTIALCRIFDFDKDKIIFDVGHQSYTYKILTGRSLEGLRTRTGPSGFQKLGESKYDHFECGHSSTSISVANGMAIARDIQKLDYDVIAYIGDGSIVNGLALEGLNMASQGNHKIIIVLNDNGMSISKSVGALSRFFRKLANSYVYNSSKSFLRKILGKKISSFLGKIKDWFKRHLIKMNMFDEMGYAYIGPIDGHNIKAMEKALKKAKKFNKSVVVHIKTIKGKGYEPAEKDQSGEWHGVTQFNKAAPETKQTLKRISWSEAASFILQDFMEVHKNVVTIVPATEVGSYLSTIRSLYPDRFIDVGIAEEHAITMAGGLSINGNHPVISIYSTFLQRGYDEIIHDLARMNLPATFLIDRAGLVGEDGDTHQGLYDEAFLISIPNTIITMPRDTYQLRYLLEESLHHNAPFFIRYPKEESIGAGRGEDLEFGKWLFLNKNNNDSLIISVGPITVQLRNYLSSFPDKADLVQALFIKPLDLEALKASLSYKRIIIADIYATKNGFVKEVTNFLALNKYQGEIVIKSIDDVFVPHMSIDEQKEFFKVTLDDITKLL